MLEREKLAKSMFKPLTSFHVDGKLLTFFSGCCSFAVAFVVAPDIMFCVPGCVGASTGESIKALGLGWCGNGLIFEVGCRGGNEELGMVEGIPIKDVGPPNNAADGCVLPTGGALIRFGMDVKDPPDPPPNPPNKSPRSELCAGFALLVTVPDPPKRSKSSPAVASLGDGGAGIPVPNKFWSVLFVLLSQEELAPPNADVKSAKSPS